MHCIRLVSYLHRLKSVVGASTNITPFSSTNELNESNESNTTNEHPEETQSNVETVEDHAAETNDAANPTNDLHIESIRKTNRKRRV